MSPRSPDEDTKRRQSEARLWLGFGLLQGLMALIIGLYVLSRGGTGPGLAAIGVAVVIMLWSGVRVWRLSR